MRRDTVRSVLFPMRQAETYEIKLGGCVVMTDKIGKIKNIAYCIVFVLTRLLLCAACVALVFGVVYALVTGEAPVVHHQTEQAEKVINVKQIIEFDDAFGFSKIKPEPEPEQQAIEATVVPSYIIPANSPEVPAETVESPAQQVATEIDEDGWSYPETFTITHYCHCALCNGEENAYGPVASGVMPEVGRTVAVDPSVIPLGSEVLINGNIYVAEDTGVIGHVIDIFCSSHSEAKNLGRYKTEVRWR